MYMPLNQYHVVMEVAPEFQGNPEALKNIYVQSSNGTQVPLSAFAHFEPNEHVAAGESPGTVSVGDAVVQSDARSFAERCDQGDRSGRRADRHASHGSRQLPGNGGGVSGFAASSEPWLILAALVTVYIVLGILYESFIHPITILSTLPSAGVGALLALLIFHTELSVIALIGIILLIGIVKKNAIMMVDFALAAERNEGKDSDACDLRGVHAAFPADHDDHDGGDAGRPAAGVGTRM